MKDSKAVLVTGGAGFVGSHLCEHLKNKGYSVTSLDNYSTGSKDNHVDGVEYRKGHTKDIELHVPETPELVYHLGEYARVEQSFEDIENVLDFNVVGTHAVLEFCRKKNVKIVYAGSSTKFGDGGLGRDQSPYAWTKASNTELVQNYGSWFGIPYAVTYFYNVYGPRERGTGAHATVIGIFKEKFQKGEALPVVLPGTQKRNFTHVDDIVRGLVSVGEGGAGDGYGLGSSESYSIMEIAEMFGTEIKMLPERKGNRMASDLDTSRAGHEFGWRAEKSIRDYVSGITATKVHD